MSETKFPWLISVFKGENRILIIPIIGHIGGFSVDSEQVNIIQDLNNAKTVGNGVFDAINVIKTSPLASSTPKERKQIATWEKGSKYKSWVTFWKNNYMTYVKLYETGKYEVYSTEKMQEHKGVYHGCIKKFELPATATAEEIGQAVLDAFKAAEDFYAE